MLIRFSESRQFPGLISFPKPRRPREGHPRRVGDARFHRVEVAAHEGCVLVAERHVDGRKEMLGVVGLVGGSGGARASGVEAEIGAGGIRKVVETALTDSEKASLLEAAEAVRAKQADVQSL